MISTLKEVREALHKARRQITHADVAPHQCIAESITKLDALIADTDKAEPKWTRPVEYTPPHMGRKPLTKEHIERIYDRYGGDMINCTRAIERAHGIGAKP